MTDDDLTPPIADETHETAKKAAGRKRASKRASGKSKKKRKPGTAVQSFNLDSTALQLVHPDPAKQKAIAGYLKHGTVAGACAMARIGRATWYRWIDDDAEFKALAGDAHEVVVDQLEHVAATRAKKGSDTLLIFLLKAARRGKFGDRQTITIIDPAVQMALKATIDLVASRPTWDSSELLDAMEGFWK